MLRKVSDRVFSDYGLISFFFALSCGWVFSGCPAEAVLGIDTDGLTVVVNVEGK